jgi:hypothetical protein
MEIKIMKLDPLGIGDEETIKLPFVEPVKRELINGLWHEPRKKWRYLLAIGDFTYTINPENGELSEVEHLRKNKTLDC